MANRNSPVHGMGVIPNMEVLEVEFIEIPLETQMIGMIVLELIMTLP